MTRQRSLPPLSWLRAFESAGRLGSFKEAAGELNVSPSTISHQVRDLERHLGKPMFERASGRVVLTSEGAQLLTPLESAFALIAGASESLHSRYNELTIGAFPFLMHEVLTPAAGELKVALGVEQLGIRNETSRESLMRAKSGDRLDVVVRYESGNTQPGFELRKLFDIELVPIQSADREIITDAETLVQQPVVRVVSPFDAWTPWREAMGLGEQTQTIALSTDSYHSAVLAVSRGEGICLGVMPFLKPWLDDGKVVALDQFRVPIDQGAYLVYALHNRDHPAIPRLQQWFQQRLA